jgi:hypothetical protein
MRPHRSIDLFFVATFAGFAATSLLFDRTAALDIIGPDSIDPFARALYWYAIRYDPLVVENPLFLRLMSAISAFVFGPLYIYLAHGFWRQRARIRTAGLVYGWVMVYSMVVHIVVELWGELPPPNLVVFWLVYAIYLVVPILLLWRLRAQDPFDGYRMCRDRS